MENENFEQSIKKGNRLGGGRVEWGWYGGGMGVHSTSKDNFETIIFVKDINLPLPDPHGSFLISQLSYGDSCGFVAKRSKMYTKQVLSFRNGISTRSR